MHPQNSFLEGQRSLHPEELPLEFMMNAALFAKTDSPYAFYTTNQT